MKKNISLAINTLLLLMLFSISNHVYSQGQHTTQGKDFWLSFGNNDVDGVNSTLQVRVVATKTTSVELRFTENSTSKTFNVNAGQVYTYTLSAAEKALAYSNATGLSNKSMRIISNENVSVFAINLAQHTTDATNVLPITNYGTSYFHISYKSMAGVGDGYTLIAMEDNTVVKEEGAVLATLNKGQVYSKYFGHIDITGRNITSDKPIAYFTTNSCVNIPIGYTACDCLFQQHVPIHSWGTTFLIPVTKQGKERVRVVASQDGTVITQSGGDIKAGSVSLNAGQFVELEVYLANNGCYITSNKPVAVASFLTGLNYGSSLGDPAMAWVPPLEQTVMNVAIAPFIAAGSSVLSEHFALIVTPTATKNSTTMTIGAGAPQALSGGTWNDNTSSGYSFYSIPLPNNSTYYFENAEGVSVMGYGLGSYESYYYLAAASARQLNPSFYINDIHFQDADGQSYCVGPFTFKSVANMTLNSSPGHIKWYINGTEEISARDKIEWTKDDFPLDEPQEIKLVILDVYNDEFVMYSTITVVDPQPLQITGNLYICPPATSTVLTAESGPSRYQWYKDGTAILGATQATHTIISADAGDYSVIGYYGTCESPMSDMVTVVNACEPKFRVTYDGNGSTTGTAPVDPVIYIDGGTVTSQLQGTLVKIDNVFLGWSGTAVGIITNAAEEAAANIIPAGSNFVITSDTTLYAVWSKDTNGPNGGGDGTPDHKQFSITYDGNGSTSGSVADNNIYNSGTSVVLKSQGTLVKTDNVFLGWSLTAVGIVTNAAEEAAANIISAGSNFVISANTTLYAVWSRDTNGPNGGGDGIPDHKQFSVTYDGNGSTSGSVVDNNVYNNGMSITLKGEGALAKTGYVFLGWNPTAVADVTTQAQEDALILKKQPDETFIITGHIIWYAVWAIDGNGNEIPDYKERTITYDPGMLHGVVETQIVAKGSTFALTNMNFQALNYVIIGWHTQKMPTVGSLAMENYVTTTAKFYKIGDSLTVTGDLTLYAVWAVDKNKDGFPDYGGTVIVPTLMGVSTRVGEMAENVTGNEAVTDTHVWAHENTLYIHSDQAVRANIYTLSGRLFKQLNVPTGVTSEPLKRGVYVVEIDGSRYKVVVK